MWSSGSKHIHLRRSFLHLQNNSGNVHQTPLSRYLREALKQRMGCVCAHEGPVGLCSLIELHIGWPLFMFPLYIFIIYVSLNSYNTSQAQSRTFFPILYVCMLTEGMWVKIKCASFYLFIYFQSSNSEFEVGHILFPSRWWGKVKACGDACSYLGPWLTTMSSAPCCPC